ncbi:NADH-quinone oxidoreductase subunit I [Enterocloster citroniae]|uniref:NADH-quinone oxidoreductase subunit I n=1 Tax=Enterocloster citroniae TaxID=358743 RepID=UPI0018999299|nr:4Fe-4S dicluster domain-containing protein [Enterocloster citroniae]
MEYQSLKYINLNRDKDKNKKELPELYDKKVHCCGCTACYAICPVSAIEMNPDEEGFMYPAVDASKCIRCCQCLEVCAFKVNQKAKGYY